MKIKISKQTVIAIRSVLILLIFLMVVLQVRHSAQTDGKNVLEKFFHTLSAESTPKAP